VSIVESFQKKVRVEYLSDGIWRQEWVRCTFVEMLQQMEEKSATHIKIILPHVSTGKKTHYMLVKGVKGWTARIGKPVIK